MSTAIKVEDKVYQELYDLQGKNETFNDIVEGLLTSRQELCRFLDAVEGNIKYREWQIDKLKGKTPTDR